MKNITFLLPSHGRRPTGGYKVVYEYANRLSANGYTVNIVYPATIFFLKQSFRKKIKCIIKYILFSLFKGYSGRKWFKLDCTVHEHYVWSLKQHHIVSSDYYVATAIETAMYLRDYKIPNQNKIYLIQGFENWSFPDKTVIETYHYGFKNIVIAKWLKEIVENSGATCTLINNGYDFNYFHQTVKYKDKDKLCISMMYHTNTLKGCRYGFEALHIVKKKFPKLKAYIFGVPPRPKLPSWMAYYQQPNRETLNMIYNSAAIYLGPSLTEGWGLTVGEAMICGAGVVCTDNLGYNEMAKNHITALVSPVKDAQSLANNIIYLIENDSERLKIAQNGHKFIQQFTWDTAYKKFIATLNTQD